MATAGKGTLFVYLQAAFWAACWVLCVGGCQPGLRPWTPLGASGGGLPAPRTPRPAFEKSGGKPAGRRFGFCNGMRWPAAHRERRARFVCRKARRERVGGWIAWMVENSSGLGGRRARTARTKQGRGPLAPAPALVLRAFQAHKTPPPPGVTQRRPPTPAPAHPRRP